MKIRTVAKNDKEVYAATDDDGNYYVFRLDDSHEINLGDVLNGDLDSPANLFVTLQNITQRRKVGIGVLDWGCSLDGAVDQLMTNSQPQVVYAGPKCILVRSRGAEIQFREEMLGS
jgi:hypothetical protein